MKKVSKLTVIISTVFAFNGANAVDLGEFNGTKFEVGGYIKAEGIFNQPDNADNTFDATVRQSRFNLKTSKMAGDRRLKGFIEGDFYGGNASGSTYDWRLRHAYIGIDNLTIGQTWNGQFFAIAPFDGEMINFFGSGAGTIAGNGGKIRPDLSIHYTKKGFRFTAQDPVNEGADMPDLVTSYSKRFKTGSALNFAVTAREVENGGDSDVGLGASLIGKLSVGGSGSLHGSAFTGEGMGVYSGVCVGGNWNPTLDATCDVEGGNLVKQSGYSVAYKHKFNNRLRGTVRHGDVNVDDNNDTSFDMTNVNLIYKTNPNLEYGVEWRSQSSANHSTRPEGEQIEVMAKYNF